MKIELEHSFENVYIFVSDALRYDFVPERLADRWPLAKTVSSSPVSASAFPSMATGLYPPQHGVYQFSETMAADIPTIFDLFPGESPFYFGVDINSLSNRDGITAYNNYHRFEKRLRTLDAPFLVMDRELITHAPYGYDVSGTHLSDEERTFDSSEEYWQARKGDTETILEDYRNSAEIAVERFEQRMDVLRDRGILDDTLVIFTADHGELLADHGFLMHSGGAPIFPELVYVPTLFCSESVKVSGDFMAHVDLFPTLASMTGRSVPEGLAGYDLLDGTPENRLAYNEIEHSFLRRDPFKRQSVWDADGGYVFTNQDLVDRFVGWARNFHPRYPARTWYRRHPALLFELYFQSRTKMGDPDFGKDRAKKYCEALATDARPRQSANVDEEAMERLKALGYSESDIR